jgi:hypothetical protein
VNKKERRTSTGPYPGVTLKEAREKNAALRKFLDTGKPIGIDMDSIVYILRV